MILLPSTSPVPPSMMMVHSSTWPAVIFRGWFSTSWALSYTLLRSASTYFQPDQLMPVYWVVVSTVSPAALTVVVFRCSKLVETYFSPFQ